MTFKYGSYHVENVSKINGVAFQFFDSSIMDTVVVLWERIFPLTSYRCQAY